jgi:uncharacterized membrane-anchored protein YitT (DUF2179 family)
LIHGLRSRKFPARKLCLNQKAGQNVHHVSAMTDAAVVVMTVAVVVEDAMTVALMTVHVGRVVMKINLTAALTSKLQTIINAKPPLEIQEAVFF